MKQKLRVTLFSAMLLGFTTANAGFFDLFSTKDPHYREDVTACWSRVHSTISQRNQKMEGFRIEHKGPNPKTGYRTVMFFHQQSWDTRGCVLEGNGNVRDTVGMPAQ